LESDGELSVTIEKAFWLKGVVRGLVPALRALGDKHGNLVIAAQPSKGQILVKGPGDRIEKVKPALIELIQEHFPAAPVPEVLFELVGTGDLMCGGVVQTRVAVERQAAEASFGTVPPFPDFGTVPDKAAPPDEEPREQATAETAASPSPAEAAPVFASFMCKPVEAGEAIVLFDLVSTMDEID